MYRIYLLCVHSSEAARKQQQQHHYSISLIWLSILSWSANSLHTWNYTIRWNLKPVRIIVNYTCHLSYVSSNSSLLSLKEIISLAQYLCNPIDGKYNYLAHIHCRVVKHLTFTRSGSRDDHAVSLFHAFPDSCLCIMHVPDLNSVLRKQTVILLYRSYQ